MSYLKCGVCRAGEGCRTRNYTLADVFTPQVCTVISAICAAISLVSFLVILYVTQLA